MKKLIAMAALVFLAGCGKTDKVVLDDHKDQIDQNSAEIALLQANDELQDLRLDTLEVQVADLEIRMDQAEDDIDANEVDIAALFDAVALLDQGLIDLRNDLNDAVRDLKRADRRTRRMIRRKVRSLRRSLSREVRARQIADYRLQGQIDTLESDLDSLEAREAAMNRFLTRGLFLTNLRISFLQSSIQSQLNNLSRRITNMAGYIRDLNNDIRDIRSEMATMQSQIDDVESRLVSVVYPCGENNSEEVLLQTQDGLVAYFQETRNQTLHFADTVTIEEYTIPGHYEKVCDPTWSGRCFSFDHNFVGEHTIPEQTYSVGDSASVKVLKHAYLDVLADGNYRTTDGFSCNFTVSNGEVR